MSIQQWLAVTPHILSILLSCFLFTHAWKEREERGGSALLLFLVGASLWSLMDFLHMVAPDASWSLLWTKLLYIGICIVPAAWFKFALQYTGRVQEKNSSRFRLLMIEPLLVQAVIWTNDCHHFFWTSSTYQTETLLPTIQNTYGPLFWVHTIYSYALIFSGMVVLLLMAYRRRGLHIRQTIALLLAVFFPMAGNVAYLSGATLFGFVDLSAPMFSLAAVFLFVAISRFKLLRSLPVTREDVFTSLAMGIIVLSDEDRVVDCNEAACRILGVGDGQVTGKILQHYFPEWDRLKHDLEVAEGQAVQFEMNHSGDERIFEVERVGVGARDGEENHIVLFQDITHHIRTEEELRQSQDRFKMLFEYAPSAYYIFNLKGEFLDGNRAAEEMSGYSREEVIGKTLNEIPLLEGSQFAMAVEILNQLNNVGEVDPLQTTMKNRDGERIPVEVHFYPIELAGDPVVLGVANDVRERVATQEALEREVEQRTGELEEANRDLQLKALELERTISGLKRFAYVASHDLQEPLRMVSCYTQLLQDSYGSQLDPTADEYIAYAVEGAKRMQSLIRDLVKFTRLIEPRGEKVKVDCNQVMKKVMDDLAPMITESEARITCGELPSVHAYRGQIEQILFHLVDNALKFQPEQIPDVSVQANRVDGTWTFAVKDNGIGIASHFHDRIFEIFRRLHGNKAYSGTGLGLALCKQIVENHQGTIWVESEPGSGSTFWFTWPATVEDE